MSNSFLYAFSAEVYRIQIRAVLTTVRMAEWSKAQSGSPGVGSNPTSDIRYFWYWYYIPSTSSSFVINV